MNKKVLYSISFLFVLGVLLVGAGYLLRPKDTDTCINQISDFHSIEKDSLDVIAYGSSHAWLGFDANEFEKKSGLNTYNYSCFWQSFNTTWLFFHDSLRNQSPKIAFIEAGRINNFLEGLGLEGQSYYTRKIKWSRQKVQYMRQCFGNSAEDNLSYVLPIIKFHTKWENIEEVLKPTDRKGFIETKGSNLSEGCSPFKHELIGAEVGIDKKLTKEVEELNEYEGGEVGQCEINSKCLELMDDITAECSKRDIRLVWYVTPYVGDYNYDDAMKDYVAANGGEYINLFEHLEEMGFDSQTDFADSDHLNANGARKVADYLSDYIK